MKADELKSLVRNNWRFVSIEEFSDILESVTILQCVDAGDAILYVLRFEESYFSAINTSAGNCAITAG